MRRALLLLPLAIAGFMLGGCGHSAGHGTSSLQSTTGFAGTTPPPQPTTKSNSTTTSP